MLGRYGSLAQLDVEVLVAEKIKDSISFAECSVWKDV